MSEATKAALDAVVAVAAAARHCLDASAPGIAADLRRTIAHNIARRSVAAITLMVGEK